MGSDKIHVIDPPLSFLFKLWLLAVAGLVLPWTAVHFWPDFGWVGQAERGLKKSLEDKKWHEPWQAIDQKSFSSGWIRCSSLEDAIRLDQKIDDGKPHSGKLVLSEGGLAWRGQ